MPNTNYQFIIEFDFGSALVTSAFTFIVQINPDFPGNCFSQSDLNQQITWFVDPAKLKQNEEVGLLTVEEIEVLDNINKI